MEIKLVIFDKSTEFVERVSQSVQKVDTFSIVSVRTSLRVDSRVKQLVNTDSVLIVSTELPGFDRFVRKLSSLRSDRCWIVGALSEGIEGVDAGRWPYVDALFSKRRTVTDLLVTIGMLVGAQVRRPDIRHVNNDETNRLASLTKREREIFDFFVAGYTRKQISNLLSRSVRTVDVHRLSVMKKLGLQHNLDFLAFAIRNRCLPPKHELV